MHTPRSPIATWLILALGAAFFVHNASRYLPFIADDALISLRYSQRLLEGAGLTWTDGERVEGYSNLLWVLTCAALGAAGLDLIDAARVAGLGGALLALIGLTLAWRARTWSRALALVAGIGVLATSHSLAVWSVGGLEQPLVAGLLSVALGLVTRALLQPEIDAGALAWASVPLAGLAITRPDGALFALGAALGLALATRPEERPLRHALTLVVPAGTAVAAQLLFRLSYYGDYVPNTAHIKIAWTTHRLDLGVSYLAGALVTLSPVILLLVPAGWAMARSPRARRAITPPLTVTLVWTSYVVAIGGDIFPAYRHLVATVVGLAWVVACFFWALLEAVRPGDRRRWVAGLAALLLGCLGATHALQAQDDRVMRARSERWEWEGAEVSAMLRALFGTADPLLAVDPAGCMPFFTGFRSLDMLGLNDRAIALKRPADHGDGAIGHEHGDGGYVLARAPDLVLFCSPRGELRPCFRSGKEMLADHRFALDYRPARLKAERGKAQVTLYLRMTGGKVGVERRGEELRVPAWLLGDGAQKFVWVSPQGEASVEVSQQVPGRLSHLRLPEGRWRARVVTRGGEGGRAWAWSHTLGRELPVGAPLEGEIDLRVGPVGARARVQEVVLTRLQEAAPTKGATP